MSPARRVISLAVLFLLLGPPILAAQEAFRPPDPSEAMTARARWLADQFTAEPQPPDSAFADQFLQQVPKARLTRILQQYHGGLGPVTRVEPVGPMTERVWVFRFHFERGRAALIQIGIDAEAPHRIRSLLIGQDAAPGG